MDQSYPRAVAAGGAAALAAHIAAHITATDALRHWCTHRLGHADAPVTALVLGDAEAARPRPIAPREPWRFRRVHLMSGGAVLSEAENWYLPGRLPPAVRDALRSGNVPFGALVAALQPRRILVAFALTWRGAGQGFHRPRCALHLRAVVTTPSNGVIAEVHEHYRSSLIAPPAAAPYAGGPIDRPRGGPAP